MGDFKYEIKQKLGILSENEKSGWKMEVNIISWNGGPDKLDIRAWSPDHVKMTKGNTLTEDEARILKGILNRVI